MQSQNTPSPQNKIEMKSTNLIFTLHLLRFPVFLLQSSVFAFCVCSSCLFGVSFLLLSLVPKAARPKEIKSLRPFFPFSNKVVYQYVRHFPSQWKGWTSDHVSTINLLLNFFKPFSFNCIFFKAFKYLIAVIIGTTNPRIHILNSCVIVN